ncbi:hypothetical protein FOL46_009863, partial [Perkinsus olseni]
SEASSNPALDGALLTHQQGNAETSTARIGFIPTSLRKDLVALQLRTSYLLPVYSKLFQTSRGVGVGCITPQERDKVLEFLSKEKGAVWDCQKDLPRMKDIELIGHGYDSGNGERLIKDFKDLNGIEAADDAIRVLRMTSNVVFLRLAFNVWKNLPDRVYLDCVRVRPIPVIYRSLCYKCGSRDARHDHRSCDQPQICRICSSENHVANDCDKAGSTYIEKAYCKFCQKGERLTVKWHKMNSEPRHDEAGSGESLSSLDVAYCNIGKTLVGGRMLLDYYTVDRGGALPSIMVICEPGRLDTQWYDYFKEVKSTSGRALILIRKDLDVDDTFSRQDCCGAYVCGIWWLATYCDINIDISETLRSWSDVIEAYGGRLHDSAQAAMGRVLEEWIDYNGVVCHNDVNSYTFIRPVQGAGILGHQCSSIDLMLTTGDVVVENWVSHEDVRPYDHLLIEAKVWVARDERRVERHYKRIKDKKLYSKDLQDNLVGWRDKLTRYMPRAQIDDAVREASEIIKMTKEAHCRSKKLVVKASSPPWWSENLDRLRRQVRKAQRRLSRSNSASNVADYRRLRNAYNKAIRRYKSDWFFRSISEEKEYGKILRHRKGRIGIAPQPGYDVLEHHTPQQDDIGEWRVPITIEDVYLVLSEADQAMGRAYGYLSQKKDTAAGLDGIVYSDIKAGGPILWDGLVSILHSMVINAYFPDYGKDSRLIFLSKGKNLGTADDFRPICMT